MLQGRLPKSITAAAAIFVLTALLALGVAFMVFCHNEVHSIHFERAQKDIDLSHRIVLGLLGTLKTMRRLGSTFTLLEIPKSRPLYGKTTSMG